MPAETENPLNPDGDDDEIEMTEQEILNELDNLSNLV